MPEEIWKIIDEYPRYEVSNLGHIKHRETGRLKKLTVNNKGYYVVNLYGDDGVGHVELVHILVAKAFVPNPDNKPMIDHVNAIKTDPRACNLEWVTNAENMQRAFDKGLCEKTRAAAREQVQKLNSMPRTPRQREAARENVMALHKLPKTEKQLEASRKNLSSPTCRENAMESHYNRHLPIRVIETGKIYRSQKALAEELGINETAVCMCLHGKREHAGGYHFEYVDDKVERKPFLYPYQMDAVNRTHNGSILCGSVGSGKSRTGLFYYFKENGGWIDEYGYVPMKNTQDLYIITTAKKRNDLEWDGELSHYHMSRDPKVNRYKNKIVVDSWNNLPKYKDVTGAFFLLDEQRLVGNGAWTKSFLKIAKNNNWILLSATPGDTYSDYLPVFLANGFFKNRTEFNRRHVIYSRYTKYPKIDGYVDTEYLDYLRDKILVTMDYRHDINKHHEDVYCTYDICKYKDVIRRRWDIYKDEPITQASGLCFILRRIVNSDESRQAKLLEIFEDHPKLIIFYNFNYELDILKNMYWGEDVEVAEYNGQRHQPVPKGNRWVYLCQYTSACEGWSCTSTDTTVFYSQSYSYKVMTQAAGRIDRLTTPFKDLYYYHLKSRSGIDLAISKALKNKRKFNESRWVKW